ncbi:MAG: VanZ family protein [Deltaproteobacteria bacterium]|nr:VanZ family protein [Deltaproteobacteria bacterium]
MDGLIGRRIVCWGAVALYAVSLPYAINVYEALVSTVSVDVATAVPLGMLVVAGIAYVINGIVMKHPARSIVFIVPCAVVAGVMIVLEPNQAKHIHIPEYILMSWLVYEALRIDYSDTGIYLVVVLISLILGMADEIHQGIHPTRYYGWQDMVINSMSVMIGVVTIIGARRGVDTAGWRPPRWLSPAAGIGALIWAGMASIAVNGCFLLNVAGSSGQWRNFPDRLAAWDMFFVVSAGIGIAALWGARTDGADHRGSVHRSRRAAAGALLVVTAVIHVMIIGAVCAGADFR